MTLPQEHNIYVKEIAAQPEDDGPRLIYADWLEELSNPRGEFIRVQCDLEQLDPLSADYHDLNVRNLELLGEHRDEWISELLIPPRQRVFFRRGFVRHFKSTLPDMLENGDAVAQLAPLTSLHLLGGAGHNAAALAAAAWLTHVHDLQLNSVGYDAKKALPSLRPTLQSPHLINLRSLDVDFGRADVEEQCYPLLTRHGESLEKLTLRSWRSNTPPGAWDAPMKQLRELSISSNFQVLANLDAPQLQDVRLEFMSSAGDGRHLRDLRWGQVQSLELSHCRQAALGVIRDLGAFEATRILKIENCHISSFINKLFRRTSLAHCEALEVVRSNHEYEIDMDAFVTRLLKHPMLERLKRLRLPNLNSPAAQMILNAMIPLEELRITQSVLPESPDLLRGIAPTLRSLSISDSTIAPLLEIEFPELQRLEIRRCNYGDPTNADGAVSQLLSTTSFPKLTELRLVQCELGAQTLRALADASDCPELRVFDFAENQATSKEVASVLESPRLPHLRRMRFPVYRRLKQFSAAIRNHGSRFQYTERNEAGFYGV